MIRRPPRSTLFPTRRSSDLQGGGRGLGALVLRRAGQPRPVERLLLGVDGEHPVGHRGRRVQRHPRSEEHTSELQSRQYLVCRLLLEKKTKRRTTISLPTSTS